MIVAYNGVNNPPFARFSDVIPLPHVLEEVADDVLLAMGPIGHDPALTAAAKFLSYERNASTFGKGTDVSAGNTATM